MSLLKSLFIKKFIFNNQKIFEPLLDNKNNDETKKVNLTLKKEDNYFKTIENKNDNSFN